MVAGRVSRSAWGLALVLALLVLALARVAPEARADGDPASDILLTNDVFLPFYPSVSGPMQARLKTATRKARRAGYPIKVALIPTFEELGAEFSMFGHPDRYAKFLSHELFRPPVHRKGEPSSITDPVLVVMPKGFGLGRKGRKLSVAAIGKVSPPSLAGNDKIAEQGVIGIKRLAAKAGHPIRGLGPAPRVNSAPPEAAIPPARPPSSSSSSSSGWVLAVILVGVALAILVAAAAILRARRRPDD
jgi:hypothetical protein